MEKNLPETWIIDELSGDLISHDECQKCGKVFMDAEWNQAKKDNFALCDDCRVDVMVNDLRHQGR